MDGFQAYKYFTAVKLHFTTDKYDVFEMNGRVAGSRATFEKRNDRGLFEKLASKFSTDRELIQFFVANFAYGNNGVVYSTDSYDYFDTWNKRKQSIARTFEMDLLTISRRLESLNQSIDHLFDAENGSPYLLHLFTSKAITLETMSILNDLDPYLDKWEPLIMVWGNEFRIIKKVKKFVKYNEDVIKSKYGNFMKEFTE